MTEQSLIRQESGIKQGAVAELRAVAKKYGPVALVHFDSHSDLCDEVFGQKYNHGTPFRRAIEEGLIDPSHSIQIGMRGSLYDPNEHKMAAELGMKLIPAHKVREMGLPALIETAIERVGDKPCFLTFDIDFIDPAYAPGTGTPEVGGFTSLEGLELVRALKDDQFRSNYGCKSASEPLFHRRYAEVYAGSMRRSGDRDRRSRISV